MNTSAQNLWERSAVELAAGIRARDISSQEVVTSFLERIMEVNPALNALVSVSPEEAMAQAVEADKAVRRGDQLGPLHGVPVSTKVNTDLIGTPSTHGVMELAESLPDHDATCVANLRDAGAVFLGRSNTPPFSFRWFTENELHGRTLNPWSAEHTPGGSSGGAASAVAAGMIPLAQGNDIGGSVRYPAYACGVAGLRPTVGYISEYNRPSELMMSPFSFQYFAVQGPLARSVADIRLGLEAMSSVELRDVVGVPVLPDPRDATGPCRVGVVRDVGLAAPHRDVNAAIDRSAEALRQAGYDVEEIEVPMLGEAAELWTLLVVEDIRGLLPMVNQLTDEANRTSIAGLLDVAAERWGASPALSDYIAGQARRGTLIGELQDLMREFPVLLTPSSAQPPAPYGADQIGGAASRELIASLWPQLALPTIGFPGLAVPTGVVDGLPTGVQLIGGRFAESTILNAGEAMERSLPSVTPVTPAFA